MWHLLHSQYGYGLISTNADGYSSYLCRDRNHENACFWVEHISELTSIMPDSDSVCLEKWIKNIPKGCTILQSFSSDSPLAYLKTHFPEYYL